MQIGLQDHFGVAVSVEDGAFAFQFLSQFHKVEDLAVVHDDSITVFAEDGLIATGNVEDRQTRSAQRDFFALESCLLVRSAMGDGIYRMSENTTRQGFMKV